MTTAKHKYTNSLVSETSPYLLQHAHNPVNWFAFSEEVFKRAASENKPILISIGYSACHWCHVMEHESFEDELVASVMNEHFINVKVDREERSDVDMLYMQAVQLMTGHGGWPLNCFVLPDGRPFYGGTYFNKKQWLNILQNLSDVYKNDFQKVDKYAAELTNGIKQAELIVTGPRPSDFDGKKVLNDTIAKWQMRFDNEEGGPNRAPKFPLPSNYQFLLRYAVLEKNSELLNHVELTLTKMAFGGIYDQLHGGFCRYSTDMIWKVPHFEKMLYDNAQLASLYAEAYTVTKNPLYKEVAEGTLNFVEQEWFHADGFFYSAYDADSDGEEGKYYVWNESDLKELLGKYYDVFSKFFEINKKGYWEHDNYILMRNENLAQVLTETNLNASELMEVIEKCKLILKQEVRSRIKPGLDDKTITSWNAMMCSAYAKSFLSFGDEKYKTIALKSINFIADKLSQPDGRLFRTYKNGAAKINGFLEDYAFTIEAFINCYLISQDEIYLQKAKEMCILTLDLFKNPESDFLFYTGNDAETLITKSTEVGDNVIPSSNSQMALNLFLLGKYFEMPEWKERAKKMLSQVYEEMANYGSAYSNWACLALHLHYTFRELAIVGKNVDTKLQDLYKQGITNAIFAVSKRSSDLPLVKNRYIESQTLIYVCENNACKLPVTTVEEALKQLV